MRSVGIQGLRDQFFGQAGIWWVISEDFTRWSATRTSHPWLATHDSPRTAYLHAVPRTRKPDRNGIEHAPHPRRHDEDGYCYVDCPGWLLPDEERQIKHRWVAPGVSNSWYSCREPDAEVLLRRIRSAKRRED